MKIFLFCILLLGLSSMAAGEVTTRVCEADGTTLFDWRDIMVGTRLTVIFQSDDALDWAAGFAMADANMERGLLSGRGYDGTYYLDSVLPAAGVDAIVYDWEETGKDGLVLCTGYDLEAGDWFVMDYQATGIGICKAGIYEYPFLYPTDEISFTHVRTRDFDGSTIVDFADFAMLASYWQESNCNAPDWCQGTDLDTDHGVDWDDLALFADFWLEKTE